MRVDTTKKVRGASHATPAAALASLEVAGRQAIPPANEEGVEGLVALGTLGSEVVASLHQPGPPPSLPSPVIRIIPDHGLAVARARTRVRHDLEVGQVSIK